MWEKMRVFGMACVNLTEKMYNFTSFTVSDVNLMKERQYSKIKYNDIFSWINEKKFIWDINLILFVILFSRQSQLGTLFLLCDILYWQDYRGKQS